MFQIRGAWSRTADDELDRVVSAFLRPATTWSGIVLRYDNGTGETVTLARLFFLRGSSVSKSDLADACIIERGQLDLSELERHGFGTIKGGTLYPLLTRYEAAGLVTTEWRAGDGGPGRKYFALTDQGRAELTRLSADWLRFTVTSTHYLDPERLTKEISA